MGLIPDSGVRMEIRKVFILFFDVIVKLWHVLYTKVLNKRTWIIDGWPLASIFLQFRRICSVPSHKSTVIPRCSGSLASEINTLACWLLPLLRGQVTMFTLTFPLARSKVVRLWKSGRMAALISNHNNRLSLGLRRLGHCYYGNNCLLRKLLRVWEESKLTDGVRMVCSCPMRTQKCPSYNSLWPLLNYSARDLIIMQTYCCIVCL